MFAHNRSMMLRYIFGVFLLHIIIFLLSIILSKFVHFDIDISGMTQHDEMCNHYLMFYTDTVKGTDSGHCTGIYDRNAIRNLPEGSDTPLPPNPLLEKQALGENTNKVFITFFKQTFSQFFRCIMLPNCKESG